MCANLHASPPAEAPIDAPSNSCPPIFLHVNTQNQRSQDLAIIVQSRHFNMILPEWIGFQAPNELHYLLRSGEQSSKTYELRYQPQPGSTATGNYRFCELLLDYKHPNHVEDFDLLDLQVTIESCKIKTITCSSILKHLDCTVNTEGNRLHASLNISPYD